MLGYRRDGRKGKTMAYKRNSKQAQPERPALKVDSVKVTRARKWDNGGITFDMELNGISIYGCRIVDSDQMTFISFPSRKGSDGRYYNHVYARLDDATTERICKMVEDLLQ